MMLRMRFPIAVWEDSDGCFTAKTIDGEPAVAVDTTANGAMSQLRKYLQWRYRQEEYAEPPNLTDLRVVEYKIDVRPLHRKERTLFPSARVVQVRVPAVLGTRSGVGLPVCAAPLLDLTLSSGDAASLDQLVREALRQELSGLPPADLARRLPPAKFTVDTLHIGVRSRSRDDGQPQLDALSTVAEPLGGRGTRFRKMRAWRRDNLVESLVWRIRDDRASILLYGDSGVGKTTVLASAVRKLTQSRSRDRELGENEGLAFRQRFWLTSGARLIAGMQYLGEWEERCEQVIGELGEIAGVLCTESLMDLVRYGGREPTASIASFLTPFMENGELRLICEATPEQLDSCRRLLPQFASLFQLFPVPEFQADEAEAVLNDMIAERERNQRLDVEPGVAYLTYRLFHRFLPYQSFPGRAASFLDDLLEQAVHPLPPASALDSASASDSDAPSDSASAPDSPSSTATGEATSQSARDSQSSRLSRQDVYQAFQRFSGLPDLLLRDDMALTFEDVRDQLGESVIGQPEACDAAATVITRFKAGLHDPQRPLGVLLFCGPTGVGKTQLAKSLADFLFGAAGRKDGLVRLDMSEYAGYGAAERLLMQPDGKQSDLIQKIRQQPFAVLLLDEIEKADDAVFDVLLSVLDEGRLTDRYGRTSSFRSTVIIMTSNVGASNATPVGFTASAPGYEREVRNEFRPEFFNRIDSVVTFQPLRPEVIRQITEKELREVSRREGLAKLGLQLEWDSELVDLLSREGFDERYGARPLQRTVESRVAAPLARWLVSNQETARRRRLRLVVRGEEIQIEADEIDDETAEGIS